MYQLLWENLPKGEVLKRNIKRGDGKIWRVKGTNQVTGKLLHHRGGQGCIGEVISLGRGKKRKDWTSLFEKKGISREREYSRKGIVKRGFPLLTVVHD